MEPHFSKDCDVVEIVNDGDSSISENCRVNSTEFLKSQTYNVSLAAMWRNCKVEKESLTKSLNDLHKEFSKAKEGVQKNLRYLKFHKNQGASLLDCLVSINQKRNEINYLQHRTSEWVDLFKNKSLDLYVKTGELEWRVKKRSEEIKILKKDLSEEWERHEGTQELLARSLNTLAGMRKDINYHRNLASEDIQEHLQQILSMGEGYMNLEDQIVNLRNTLNSLKLKKQEEEEEKEEKQKQQQGSMGKLKNLSSKCCECVFESILCIILLSPIILLK